MSDKAKRILLAFHWYSEALHEGALRYCVERGWDVALLNTDSVNLYPRGSYDGVLSMLPPFGHPVNDFVSAAEVPVVELSYSHPDNKVWGRIPSDGRAVGRMAADYLSRRPVKSFLFVAHSPWPTHDIRWEGFRSGLARDIRPCVRFDISDVPDRTLDAGFPDEKGTRRLADFLLTRQLPVAIFGSVDQSARQALAAASLAGLKTPGDVYILGFGNRDLVSRIATVPISSIAIDYVAWAYSAMGMLDALMDGRGAPGEIRPYPPLGVMERASTGGDSGGDPLCARALEVMRGHISTPLSVSEIATKTGVSKSTLNRAFTESYGVGVAGRYLALRMEIARGLLEAGDKVESVSSSVGFSSPRAFRTAFQRLEKCSPGDYARRCRVEAQAAKQRSRQNRRTRKPWHGPDPFVPPTRTED